MKKMRSILSLVLVALMLAGACVSLNVAASTNLITNGGFENASLTGGWTARGGVTIAASTAYAYEGSKSLMITQADNTSSHLMTKWVDNLQNGTTYELSLWMYLPSALTGTGTENRAYVQMVAPAGAKQYVTKVGEWTNVTFVFTWSGSSGGSGQFNVGFDDTVAAGNVMYIDDVWVMEYEAQTFDGSMEDLSVWTVSAAVGQETGVVQNGEGALKIEGVGNATQLAAILDNNKNLTGCIKTGTGYTAGDAKIRIYDGQYATNLICETTVPVSAVWTAVPFGAIEPTSGIALIELANEGTGTVYFDSFTFSEYVDTTNKFTNPGFEGAANPASTGTLSTEKFHDGTQSLKLEGASQRYVYLGKQISVAAQRSYTVSFYYYANGTKPGILVYPLNEEGKEVGAEVMGRSDLENSTNAWTKGSFTFTVPAGRSKINVQLGFGTMNDAPAYIDDMSLTAEPIPESAYLASDNTVLWELTEGTQTVTSKYVLDAEEAGACIYIIAGYKIDKTTGVRSLENLSLSDKALTAGTNQLTDTINITVSDTAQYRYELKSFAIDTQNIAPMDRYNNIRSN